MNKITGINRHERRYVAKATKHDFTMLVAAQEWKVLDNCTHWTSAHPYAGGKAMKVDAIVERVAAKLAKVQVNADGILNSIAATVEF